MTKEACSRPSEGIGIWFFMRGFDWLITGQGGTMQDAGLLGFCDITDQLCRVGIEFAR